MAKKTVRDVDFTGLKVLMRTDFNVPLGDNGEITDDSRIRAALPSIQYVLDQGAKNVIIMSHLGRPKGEPTPEFSLKPVAEHLDSMIPNSVKVASATVGDDVQKMVDGLEQGEVLVLENTRFQHEEEGKKCSEEEQAEFAKKLASYGDVFVNDAFGTAHRRHASTAVVCEYMDTNVSGLLIEKELQYLGEATANPERPFVALIGGAKVSGKLEVLNSLMSKVDAFLIGGGMAYTFLKSQSKSVGGSLVEEELLDTAAETIKAAERQNVRFLLPTDHIVGDNYSEDANTQEVGEDIPDGWMGLDIGSKTIAAYEQECKNARTIVWNGPPGCFEMPPFAKGTMALCKAIGESQATSIIGGGDSASAVYSSGYADKMSHISTGGGASLEFLEGKTLPGVAALDEK